MSIVILALASCASETASDTSNLVGASSEPTPTAVVSLVNGVTRVVIHLSPTEGEGQIGSAVFSSEGDSTTVEISVEPQTTEAQPIHIHSGVCTDVGAVRHSLQNVVRGSSVTVIALSLKEIIGDGALVNVHESYTHASNYTACGQIPLELP
jgi:hypothetical protein